MENVFRLLTYNVHSAIGNDKKRNYDRIINVIREVDPYIINLQEVDSRPKKTPVNRSFLFEKIASSLPYYGVRGVTMLKSESAYGNAMFCRDKALQVQFHDISYQQREPRGVMDCMYKINGYDIRILNTHLGLKKKERAFQIDCLQQLLQERPHIPTLLSGDFNDWNFFSRSLTHLKNRVKAVKRKRTFPARYPLFSLDLIFYNTGLNLMNYSVHKSKLSRLASDHLPFTADFEFVIR